MRLGCLLPGAPRRDRNRIDLRAPCREGAVEDGSGQPRRWAGGKGCAGTGSGRALGIARLGVAEDASSSYSLCCWGARAVPRPRGKADVREDTAALVRVAPAGLQQLGCRNSHFQLVSTLPACVHAAHTRPLLQEGVPGRAGRSRPRPLTSWVLHPVPRQPFLGCCAWFACSVCGDVPTTSLQRCEVPAWWQRPSGTLKAAHRAAWCGHGRPFPRPPGIRTALR